MIRVYCDIVGDLFHVGHLNLFKKAIEYGTHLIVGIHSDSTVESYKRKPIFCEEDRYELISNCRLVNEIVKDAPLHISIDFIREHNIDVVVHGDDPSPHFMEQHKVPLELGIMKYTPYTQGISTSDIIKRLRHTYFCINESLFDMEKL